MSNNYKTIIPLHLRHSVLETEQWDVFCLLLIRFESTCVVTDVLWFPSTFHANIWRLFSRDRGLFLCKPTQLASILYCHCTMLYTFWILCVMQGLWMEKKWKGYMIASPKSAGGTEENHKYLAWPFITIGMWLSRWNSSIEWHKKQKRWLQIHFPFEKLNWVEPFRRKGNSIIEWPFSWSRRLCDGSEPMLLMAVLLLRIWRLFLGVQLHE